MAPTPRDSGRPAGNAPLPSYCDDDLAAAGFSNGAPLTYESDSTNSYELGAKNRFGSHLQIASSVYYIKWRNIQQNVYVAGACGLQFYGQPGRRGRPGRRCASGDLRPTRGNSIWPQAIPTRATPGRLAHPTAAAAMVSHRFRWPTWAMPFPARGRFEYSPGLSPPWTVAIGAEYGFKVADHPAFVRLDYQYQARNNWPSVLQDPNTSQYNLGNALSATPGNTYTLSSTVFASLRAGVDVGHWALAAFVDNLFDSHTVTNYQLGQPDSYNQTEFPVGSGTMVQTSPSAQQNAYTFRPRTIGITATLHL